MNWGLQRLPSVSDPDQPQSRFQTKTNAGLEVTLLILSCTCVHSSCFFLLSASMQDKANADKKKRRPRSSINMNQLKWAHHIIHRDARTRSRAWHNAKFYCFPWEKAAFRFQCILMGLLHKKCFAQIVYRPACTCVRYYMPVLGSYVCGHAASPKISVHADLPTTLKYSGKNSVEQLSPIEPWWTSALKPFQ